MIGCGCVFVCGMGRSSRVNDQRGQIGGGKICGQVYKSKNSDSCILLLIIDIVTQFIMSFSYLLYIIGERVWSSGTVQDSGSLDREFKPR